MHGQDAPGGGRSGTPFGCTGTPFRGWGLRDGTLSCCWRAEGRTGNSGRNNETSCGSGHPGSGGSSAGPRGAKASPGTGTGTDTGTDPARLNSARTHDPTARPCGTGDSVSEGTPGRRCPGGIPGADAAARTWGGRTGAGAGPGPLLVAPIAAPPGRAPGPVPGNRRLT